MKVIHIKQISLIVFFLSSFSVFGQSDVYSPKASFGIDLGVPTRANNKEFGRVMEGLFNGGIDFRYNIYKGLTLGAGAKYSFFTLQTFTLNNIDISGGYQIPAAYLRVGYEKFTSDRVSINGSIRGGYAAMISFNDSCSINNGGPIISNTFFVEPQVELVLLTDRTSSHGFSGVIGYSFYMHEFKGSELCFSEVPNSVEENYEGITRFLSIGFGYHYYLGRDR